MKQRNHRNTGPYDPQRITKAVTHIRLEAANAGKLTALDDLAQVFLSLCQQYVTLFCTQERPNKLRVPLFATSLSERWQRVAIQQAAGIARSWRTNRANAYQDYVDDLLDYHERQAEAALDVEREEPTWKEWNIPTLRQTCIQANANVAVLEPAQDSRFDYWLKISTLAFRKQLLVPVKLANYHREALKDKTLSTSVTLNKRGDGWWLTLQLRAGRSSTDSTISPGGGRGRGHRQFRHHQRRAALRHLPWQAPRAAQARPGETQAQSQTT